MKFKLHRCFLFFIIFLFVVSAACRQDFSGKIPPVAVKGVLDLSDWDFLKDGPVNLNGEYEFYWKQLVQPEDFFTATPPKRTGFIKVPSFWNTHKVAGEKLPGIGYATYRLRILLKEPEDHLALKILEISTAYAGYINGKQVCLTGAVGKTRASTIPRYRPRIVDFETESSQIEILFQVSNFHHRRGGAWEVIQLGTETQMRTLRERRISFDLFLFGSIFIIALYHFGLFILRRKARFTFYFGVFCIMIALRLLTTGEKYLIHLFPSLSWELMVKLEYLSYYLAVPAFVLFMRSLFHMFSKRFQQVIVPISAAFACMVILTPARIFSHTLLFYHIITVIALFYGLYVIIRALLQKNIEAFVFFSGFMILFLMTINDILHVERIIQTGFFAPLGLFIFILSQAFLISLRFSNALKTVVMQRKELKGALEAQRKEILDRMRAEEALRDSHERFLTVLDSIDADVYVADLKTYEVYFMNKHMKDSYGHDLIGRACWKVFHSNPGPCSHCTNDKLLDSGGNPTGVCVWEGKNPITQKWHLNYDRAIKWVDGRFVRLEVATDVTELKEAGERLRQSEEKYRTILHSIEDGYYEVDIAGNLTFFNESLCEIIGYPRKALMGMNYRQFMSEATAKKVYETFNVVYRTGKATKAVDWETSRADRSKRLLETSVSLMRDPAGEPVGFRGVARDVTERKNAEEQAKILQQQLMLASKMVALGMLVSGVAHEINNPNNFIMLNAPILSEAWQDAMPILENYYEENGDFILGGMKYSEMRLKYPELFSGILDGANRINHIVTDLKNYVKDDTADLTQTVDINSVLKSAIKFVSNLIEKATHHFSIEYGENIPRLKGNFQQLEQVIINLLQNACHALQDNAKGISVSSGFDKQRAMIVIRVRDEGIGIPPDILPLITDPLFTTKHDSGGFGLGLSISSSIIKEHGGSMNFTSEINNGTTAEILLPIDRG